LPVPIVFPAILARVTVAVYLAQDVVVVKLAGVLLTCAEPPVPKY